MKLLVTGGLGFIGTNFIQYWFSNHHQDSIVNLDKVTYAANPQNLTDIEGKFNYRFVQGDILDEKIVDSLVADSDVIVHFAAESHVDRSIDDPLLFVKTNVLGTYVLLNAAKKYQKRFHHVSTDEVFGSIPFGSEAQFNENTSYDPSSPYSASKASSDHFVRSFYKTFNLPITISNCSNNYGPYQFPEKLIPVMIMNIKDGKKLPVYGDGKNIRDWLYVDDHNSAVWAVVNKGRNGETYNIGGENEWENIKLVNVLCEKMAARLGKEKDHFKSLIDYVKDRPGHDRRYAINCDKLKKELGWKQAFDFDRGLDLTIDWFLSNDQWISRVRSGEYRKWIEKNYGGR